MVKYCKLRVTIKIFFLDRDAELQSNSTVLGNDYHYFIIFLSTSLTKPRSCLLFASSAFIVLQI